MSDRDAGDEETFSMEDLEKDLKKGRGARRAPWFLGGLVVGVAGTLAVPPLVRPYLPEGLRGDREVLSGPVLGEERDGDRLLLTIDTEPGALIASFTERVSDIALLVEPGDVVTISVPDYEPFVENPDFEGVRKGTGAAGRGEGDVPETEGLPEGGVAREGAEIGVDSMAATRDTAGAPADTAGAPARPDTAGEGDAAPPDTLSEGPRA